MLVLIAPVEAILKKTTKKTTSWARLNNWLNEKMLELRVQNSLWFL